MTQSCDTDESLIEEYIKLLVSNAAVRADRREIRRQLRVVRAALREMAEWRLALIAALPIAAAIGNQQKPTVA